MTTFIGIAAVLLIFGIIILLGKGDMLIAGFNTASKEEKEKIDIKRLRLLTGGLCILLAVLIVPSQIIIEKSGELRTATLLVSGAMVILAGIAIVLANTWAKKD